MRSHTPVSIRGSLPQAHAVFPQPRDRTRYDTTQLAQVDLPSAAHTLDTRFTTLLTKPQSCVVLALRSHPIPFCSQCPKQKLPEFSPSLRKSVP
ncbi:uncharacterized protein FFB20_04259 [Fusarium fujikuroi]|uniref:Uncharacterized protein n=1 Tax=Fusarium fujikuroi TaxID=5127 RepID=A0A2H3R8E8_FUSFU|nr:uncharacterized protein FFE2_00723 [Fusarium fujikuroi]SCN69925.1 uncharacterized protein FFC1_00719 [Fusarium fujikuroi]SCN72898.1 uncharacterized protein FFB20_04259 [Fusarium fujikuroi]SCN73474.1 uncharacterized protein FFM5_00680 [Fusarium fujikuroi]SCO29093.1 uncharacterized protein FFNC_00720 [Fusarium fujikuroi]